MQGLNEGLNVLDFLGKDTVIVPHFNNQEGGDHDIHAQKPEIVSKIINSWIEGKFIESQKI